MSFNRATDAVFYGIYQELPSSVADEALDDSVQLEEETETG